MAMNRIFGGWVGIGAGNLQDQQHINKLNKKKKEVRFFKILF